MKQGLISIIIPSYNEGYNVKLIHESLKKEFKTIHYDYEIFFINDGSVDDTLQQIKDLAAGCSRVKYISFLGTSEKKPQFLRALNMFKARRLLLWTPICSIRPIC